jgi:8-oxo-dGTP diphosphatase
MTGSSREFPEAPIVGVGVVVWKGGRVLLIRRAKEPRKGQWSLPGGRQELGESVRDTAIREIREEAGIQIEVVHLLDVIDTITPEDASANARVRYHYTLVDFDADWTSGEAKAGGDASEVVWADPADLTPYDLWWETHRIIGLSAEIRETLE